MFRGSVILEKLKLDVEIIFSFNLVLFNTQCKMVVRKISKQNSDEKENKQQDNKEIKNDDENI